ncbi:hypothetical protein [Ramlibacter albus]|uniref:Uncharacterized protein n=1 Tax=Ramlibacter albus TaxID=2079448 RepID=A0A923MGT5_9BURK|nr:hypothetical protein [Ramlibacter albus]MBC5768692.1 hypothetical protein [Ramlibacter albus]
MPILIERTSKKIKLLAAVGLVTLHVGAVLYLFSGWGWTWVLPIAGAVAYGLSRLLAWWHHH